MYFFIIKNNNIFSFILISPYSTDPLKVAHTFIFFLRLNFFFFFYQNLSIYILHLVEVFCSVYHFKVFYSKITEIKLVLIHISLSYFGTHFPSFGNTKMFHQPSDPSLLDTVVYGLVKGNKKF